MKTSWVAVFMTDALTSAGAQPGWACLTRAAMPATCGVAIEVPDLMLAPTRRPDATDAMPVPGAATSGLATPSEPCTPRDEPLLSVSPISGIETNDDSASDGPTVIVTSPASIAGRSAAWLGP